MDPLLMQLSTGLAVDGLAAVLSRSASELTRDLTELDALIAKAIEEVEDVPAIDPSLGGEALRPFLRTAEVAALVRRVYASRLTDEETSLDGLRGEFVDLWEFHVGDEGTEPERAGRLFDVILAACDGTFEAALSSGYTAALEARAWLRQRQLLTKLESLHASIEALREQGVSAADVDGFAGRYRRLVRQREGTIVPPDFDAAPKVPIDALYVQSPLERVDLSADQPSPGLAYADLQRSRGRKVILGNPGNGKTTLTKKLATDYAAASAEAGLLTPFRVVLKDYGARKQEDHCSILEFIESRISSDYQLEPPAGAVEYMLSSGAAVVILDGLDELLDTSYRREISADIESFATLYPSLPLLVTSREVGYAQAPLSDELFDSYRLAPFSERQTRAYVDKWFARDPGLSDAERQRKVGSFMDESRNVGDLRSNPLMLALMCLIYKGEGYIPQNRPDVYERCSTLLFDRWDRQRKIEVPLEIKSHIRPAMQYLAHWIYTDSGVEAEVRESAIVNKTKEYLRGRRYEDPMDAEAEAKRFVEFCAGRAWVFTDLGTTGDGERLFNFTHRTFLEYFAAGHLVRAHSDAAALNEVLIPHIERREWDVVAQLAYQMLDRNVEGAGQELLEELVEEDSDPTDHAQTNRFDFALHALEFLVPPPATVRALVSKAVKRTLDWGDTADTWLAERPPQPDRTVPTRALISLARTNPENLGVVMSSLGEELIGAITGVDEDRRVNAGELGLRLGNRLPPEFDHMLADRAGADLLALAELDRGAAVELVARGRLELETLVERFGIRSLFQSTRYRCDGNSLRTELAEVLALRALALPSKPLSASVELARELVGRAGRLLLAAETPWYSSQIIRLGTLHRFHVSDGEEPIGLNRDELTAEQWFGVAAILAAFFEENERESWRAFPEEPAEVGPEKLAPAVKPIAPLFLAKKARDQEEEARELEAELGFDVDQQALLRAWRAGELQLFKPKEPELPD